MRVKLTIGVKEWIGEVKEQSNSVIRIVDEGGSVRQFYKANLTKPVEVLGESVSTESKEENKEEVEEDGKKGTDGGSKEKDNKPDKGVGEGS